MLIDVYVGIKPLIRFDSSPLALAASLGGFCLALLFLTFLLARLGGWDRF